MTESGSKMTEEQLAIYLSKLEEQERETDLAKGVFDPLININWGSSASEKEIEFRETIVKYLTDQNHPHSYDDLVANLNKQIPKEEMQKLLDSLVQVRLVKEKLDGDQKAYASSARDKFSSEKMLASVFSDMAKEAWPNQDEEPNYSMDQFCDPAMEKTPEPTSNDAKNSSAFKVYIAFFDFWGASFLKNWDHAK